MRLLPPLPSLMALSTPASDIIRKSHGFTNTAHWIIPGILMQAERPRLDQISNIVREGARCRTFVCLQAECVPEVGSILLDDGGVQDWECESMHMPAYCDEVQAITDEIGEPSPIFLHYGIRDMSTAKSIDGLVCVVSELANRIRLGETIYLHCLGGKGRAGLVSACLLMELYEKNIDAGTALEYIHSFCQLRNMDTRENIEYTSPETEDQRAQVREFYRRVIGK